MKPDKTIQTWEIILLTPLHVGDGETLFRDMDYVTYKNSISVYHIDTVIDSIADNPSAVSDLARMMNLEKFIQSYKLDVKPEYTIPVTGNGHREIKRFLKNAHGEPYLAGSTLKGAIRTALWNTLDRSKLPPASNFKSFEKQVKTMDGQPHDDFLRPLSVSDSAGLNAQDSLGVEEVKIFNVKMGNKPGWKDFSTRSNKDQFEEVGGIYVEALKPSTRLHVRIELNDFLQKMPVSKLWPIPKAKGLAGMEDLADVVNEHSRKIAETERDFFAGYSRACSGATLFYNDLLQNGFNMIKKNPEAFFMRMAWSSGWKGMTGDWLHGVDLEAVRREKRLGKQGVSIFPKTRRLAIKDGIPSQPLGWVLVTPSQESFYAKVARPVSNAKPSEMVLSKTKTPDEVSSDNTIVAPPEKKYTSIETVRETWENINLVYTPNNGTITATSKNKKATVKGKKLVPEKLHKLLFGKKKFASGQKVDVEAVGNAYKIVKIY